MVCGRGFPAQNGANFSILHRVAGRILCGSFLMQRFYENTSLKFERGFQFGFKGGTTLRKVVRYFRDGDTIARVTNHFTRRYYDVAIIEVSRNGRGNSARLVYYERCRKLRSLAEMMFKKRIETSSLYEPSLREKMLFHGCFR